MHNTKVKELMSEYPILVDADTTLQDAAQTMKDIDCGILPVGSKSKLDGIITDRDIVIRAISEGKDPAMEKVGDYMTGQVYGCSEDDFLEDAADKMRDHKVSRLVVRDHKAQVSGILSFGGILRKNADAEEVANVVKHAIHKAAA